MHPTLMQDIARYRQVDMIREAERARLAHQVSADSDAQPRRRFNLSWRRHTAAGRPALSH